MNQLSYLEKFKTLPIETSLQKSFGALSLIFYQITSDFDLKKHMSHIRKAIISGEIDTTILEQESSNCITRHHYEAPYKIHFRHACVFIELANIAFENNETEKAWFFISEANHRIGLTQSGHTYYFGVDEKETLKANAKKGSKKVYDNYAYDRKEVIRLINQSPAGGWLDEVHALTSIRTPLKELIIDNLKSSGGVRFKLKLDNFEQRISRWINHDKSKANNNEPQGEVRKAYEANSQFRLSNPNNY